MNLTQDDNSITLDNGHIQVRLTRNNGRITQEFAAERDGQWITVARAFAPPRPAPEGTIPLYLTRHEEAGRQLNVADDYRLLVTEGLSEMHIEQHDDEQAIVILSGAIGENQIRQSIRLCRGEPSVHIDVTAHLAGDPPRLEYLLSPFEVEMPNPPGFTHLPAHKRGPDYVAGDRMFFSPVAMMQDGDLFAAIVPDLDVLNESAVGARNARQHPDTQWLAIPVEPDTITMPTVLDLELQSGVSSKPLLAYGLMDTFIRQHVFYQHDHAEGKMVRTLSQPKVRYAMDLFISADAHRSLPRNGVGLPPNGVGLIAPYLWQRYAIRLFNKPRPQAMPFEHYPTIVYPAYARYQGYDIDRGVLRHRDMPHRPEMNAWQQWEIDGKLLSPSGERLGEGGSPPSQGVTLPQPLPEREGGKIPVGGWRMGAPQWYDLVYFTPWFNNVFDAQGMHYWGTHLGDDDLIDKARRVINLILSAPQKDGMFPSLFMLNEQRWSGSLWNPPAENYDPNAAERYFDWTHGAYQTAATSNTAGFLLEYYRNCEPHPEIVPFVQRYADFLIANMEEQGAVPAWFGDDLQPLPSMRFNADGGAHIWVLSELHKITPDERYLEAAQRAAHFLITEIFPAHRWIDFECFYSCAVKPETFFDPHTGQGPRNTMSMIWAMRGFLSLYEVTQDRQYLDAAEAVADYASLFQAVWAPHFIITAYPFGGYSPQIGDAEWLDQRSNVMAGPMIRLGLALQRQDLLERGVALARSGLALMNHPRHRVNDIYRFSSFPMGLGPENIDHDGFPQLPLNSAPTWSIVGTMAALADVSRLLGGAYIDVANDLAVGADGVRIREVSFAGRDLRIQIDNQLANLPRPHEQPFDITLIVRGLLSGAKDLDGPYRIIINDSREFEATAHELAEFTIRINPTP